ncbi:hypothetical protein [Hafnia paralvei]|uniref:hypothetical protein n=1 Tax=Hafnia paralvei TaxID=546367 RepID=UPI001034E733|nr:hypothetical protein [Hafnia paralvei]TBL65504.1 hypothetical protein EYY97_00260 [Hafnia paralvei]
MSYTLKHKENHAKNTTVLSLIFIVAFVDIFGIIDFWQASKTLDIVNSIQEIIALHCNVPLWSTLSVIKIMDDTPEKYSFIPRTNKAIATPLGGGEVLVYSNDKNSVSIKIIGLEQRECFWLGSALCTQKMPYNTDVFVNESLVINNGYIPLCNAIQNNTISFLIKKVC